MRHYATDGGLSGVPVWAFEFRGAEIVVNGCVQIEPASFAVRPAEAVFVDNLAVLRDSHGEAGHVCASGDLVTKIAESRLSGGPLATR